MPYTDPDRKREYQRQWIASRRAQWIAERGGSCVQCGSTDRIEIDHIDPSQKSYNPTSAWSLVEGYKELNKCQILCHACHRIKTHGDHRNEHGTKAGYVRNGCRCPDCRSWNAARVARSRARAATR
jgi:hypothetical protein